MPNQLTQIKLLPLCCLFAVALWGCSENKPEGNPANAPLPVNTYQVQKVPAIYYDQYPGTIVALKQVELRPQAEGYITGIYFNEGELVYKGQKLYSIDPSKNAATFSQSQAAVRVAEANLEQAQKDADRYTYLNQHEAIARQTLDHALTTLQNAKNQLAAAKEDVVKAKTSLSYSTVVAPFGGVIGISQVKVGTSVSVGQTVLNTISSRDPMAADIQINEKQVPRFVRLLQGKSAPSDSVFTLLLPDNTHYSMPGQLALLDRGVNPQTGTITVRLQFPNAAGVLVPGMSCKVRVKNDDTEPQLQVPGKSVVEQMGEYFVYIMKDTLITPPGDTTAAAKMVSPHALQRKVRLGTQIGDMMIIKSGIEEGDLVITDGIQKMRDGSPVKPGPAKKP
jgi:membrane fusion protein (multidrug efflux system)